MSDEPEVDVGLEDLLAFLLEKRGLDFTGYKRASLSRRIRSRLDAVGVEDFEAYRDLLEADPAEQIHLTNTILINVTEFYRDETAWAYISDHVIPAIVARKASDELIRVWSAGCASGQEAYTIAMLLADHLGIEQFKDRVKVFATDVDDEALAEARSGVYTARQLEAVPSEQRERYFEPTNGDFVFRPDCRRSVIFGHHDVTGDAPISRLDLLICRNVLMYFVVETQRRVLQRFRFALGEQGRLFLGKAETVLAHSDLFAPVEPSLRVFEPTGHPVRPIDLPDTPTETPLSADRLQALASQWSPVAQLVLDIDGRLTSANERARSMFELVDDDLGRRFSELAVARQPVELRPYLREAYTAVDPVVIRDVVLHGPGDRKRYLEVSLVRLDSGPGHPSGLSVTFADVSELGRTRADLERSTRDLRVSNDELTSVNLRLEHSNEELQSANEELETTNEELQSANEELETMNEELRSANEELETMNEELLLQAREIERAERFLTAILDSLVGGVAVLSHDFDVLVWNRAAEDLFGLRSEEVTGRSFLALDIGLPVGEVGPLLHALSSPESADAVPADRRASEQVILDAFDRRGRSMSCRVTVRRFTRSPETDAQLVVFFDPLLEGST
jgi:two-component system, chemotaxis family, CheB/CheR fusion protein